jgi:diguanylate cyclase (GGDEF)-like protein
MLIGTDKKRIKNVFVISVLCFLLTVISANIFLREDSKTADSVTSLLYALLVFQVLAACIHAYKNSKSYKRLWLYMSTGMAFWAAGVSLLAYYTITLGSNSIPSPSIADIFSIAYVPITAGVMFSVGKIRRPFDNEKKQFLTNIAMLGLVAFVVCYKFALVPTLYGRPDLSNLSKAFTMAYPLFDWFVFISLAFASRRFQKEQIEGWFVLLISAFASAIIADITFYMTNNTMNPLSFFLMIGAAVFITAASIDETTGAFIGTINRTSENKTKNSLLERGSFQALLVPMIVTLTLTFLWLSWTIKGSRIELPVLIASSILLMMLLIYKTHLLITDNAILYAKSLCDNLTGLNNHRYFQEALTKNIQKAASTHKPVSLVILDVDNLSAINNKYGHGTGDRVLKTIGFSMNAELREADEACRLSDDSFALILPRTTGNEAFGVAKQLKEAISSVFDKSFPNMNISVSMGVSEYPTSANEKDQLISTAEGALYWCKLNGKDEILRYDPEIVESLNAEERAAKVEEVALTDMVRSLAQAVDARDSYTCMHSSGVSSVATSLAKFIGLDEKTVKRIEVAGTLHDIGKIGIPDNILNKPGRLSGDEVKVIMNHPELSAQILQSTSLKEIIPAVKGHHERWDGGGYPSGLQKNEIPIEARILAIADTFDAMTTSRPYRKALPVKEALDEIQRCSGTQFDPLLAEQFLKMFGYDEISKSIPDTEAAELESDMDDNADLDKAASF